MVERLAAKYPKLKGALTANDPAFQRCRVLKADAPGNAQGYYYLEMVEAICEAKWSRETSAALTPPQIQSLGKALGKV